MKALLDWIDHRTGSKKLLHEALFENVPGGARWRYAWGSTLVFCFAVQIITGIFLWLAYNPSSQTAWESVYFIQYQMWGGWFVRGLHHYTAQAMTVLLVLHLMQVMIDGAYKAPREVNFWTGILLLLLVLALSLTGYLLPWDQKGYGATAVATGIVGIVPGGEYLERLLVGASTYGHHTLSRFFALHAGIIPGAIIVFIVAHVYLFRRHGLTPKLPKKKPDAAFWPDQVFRDAVVCLAVLLVIIFFNFRTHGAELDAPADPSEPYPARPEWYFLFLFQILKLPIFKGSVGEILGAIVVPTLILAVVIAMPYIGRTIRGHRFNLAFLWVTLAGITGLTYMAMSQDRNDSSFQAEVAKAKRQAERVIVLAGNGIPVTGATTLLRNDPLTQGPKIFAQNCASCHRFDGHDGLGVVSNEPIKGSDLKDFASREWLAGLLDPERVDSPHYFGGTKAKTGKMVEFVKDDVAKFDDGEKGELVQAIAALSAEADLKTQKATDQRDAALILEGKKLLAGDSLDCTRCHKFYAEDQGGSGPDLTGYGSREWLIAFISDPAHPRFYGKRNDRMPSFANEKILTPQEIGLVTDWIRREWYEPAKP
ncbi:MAG: cytochrome b N-terminal domain-containing protein [Opitutaceae bacterium]